MPETHARLSASKAARWLACTPSIVMEENCGIEETTSPYAAEGTLAHSLGETLIRSKINEISGNSLRRAITKIQLDDLYSADMLEYAESYADYVFSEFMKAKTADKNASLYVEEKLDYSPWAKDGFGTGDAVIITNSYFQVIDLKYGKGVAVSAENNPQAKLYALGAYNRFGFLYDSLEKIKVTIFQPRINNTNSWEVSIDDLLTWANDIVVPRAKMAHSGKGELVPGEHCRFCRAKVRCRAAAEEALVAAEMDFKEPDLLSDDELADILGKLKRITDWAEAVKKYALSAAVEKGTHFNGFKLVEGRSNRIITDPDKVKTILKKVGFEESDFVHTKMAGITDLEKLVGKKKLDELIGEYIQKPSGKPTLVPESDKRQEWGSAESDFGTNA